LATTTPTAASYRRMTKAELEELARDRNIEGRADMKKDELASALALTDLGPDALELLTAHHGRIRELFSSLEARAPGPSKVKLDEVRELTSILVKHAEIEETIFYPAVREHLDIEDEVDESLEEHHAAELLLAELEKLPAEAPRYDAKITVLRENVLHHIEEEEDDLFPQVREKLDEEMRRRIGKAMEEAWNVAPSRPHPASPDTPPGNWLAGIPAAGYDALVGVLKAAKRTVLRR
jgi:hemerythrin superfamily protein